MTEDTYAKGVDSSILKAVHEKCTTRYEGKYPQALLHINVSLDDREIAEIRKEIKAAKDAIKVYTKNNPEYEKLRDYLAEMRGVLGTFMELGRLIEDPQATKVSKTLIDKKVPALKVPSAIYRVYVWEMKTEELDEGLKTYERAAQSRGTSAKFLGEHVRDVYRFIKETPRK